MSLTPEELAQKTEFRSLVEDVTEAVREATEKWHKEKLLPLDALPMIADYEAGEIVVGYTDGSVGSIRLDNPNLTKLYPAV